MRQAAGWNASSTYNKPRTTRNNWFPLLSGGLLLVLIIHNFSLPKHIEFTRSLEETQRILNEKDIVTLGNFTGINLTNLIPDSLEPNVKSMNYRILGLGPNFGELESPLDHLSSSLAKIPAPTPYHVAKCTAEVVDKFIYGSPVDFIFLEYHTCRDGTLTLAKKLRARFPDAVIAIVDVWSPMSVHYIDSEGRSHSLKVWASQNGFPRKNIRAMDLFRDSTEPWEEMIIPGERECMDALQRETQSYMLRKEKDFLIAPTTEEYKNTVLKRLFLYENDWLGLSSKGRADCARGIADFIKMINHQKSDALGEWIEDDPSCTRL